MRLRLVPLWAAFVILAVGSSPAVAEGPNHPSLGTISTAPPIAERLKDACGVAVDSNGYVYVANYYNDAIYIFDAKHQYLTQFKNKDPLDVPSPEPLDGPCNLAVDSAGDIYVNNWHRDVVKLVPSNFPPERTTTFTPGPVFDANHSTGVAVDPDTGKVYVDDRTYIAEYEPSGAPVLDKGSPVQIGLGSLGEGYGVAVSYFHETEGQVYVADAAGNSIKVYEPLGDPHIPIKVIDGGGAPQLGFNYLLDSDLAVDPADGHLYVVDNLQPHFEKPEAVVDEFSVLGHFRGQVSNSAINGSSGIIDAEPSAVAVAGGDIFVTSGNYEDAEVQVFGPAAAVATKILTVTKAGSGAGVVTSIPAGLGCGTACDGEFDQDSTIVLKASPLPDNRFIGWTGCDSEPIVVECAVTMSTDRSVSAEFEPIPPSMTAESEPALEPPAVDAALGPARSGKLYLRGLVVDGPTATITVANPVPGALTVTGRGLRPAHALTLGAGQASLYLRLNGVGLRALRSSKRHKLSLAVELSLAPLDGSPTVHASTVVTFRGNGRHR